MAGNTPNRRMENARRKTRAMRLRAEQLATGITHIQRVVESDEQALNEQEAQVRRRQQALDAEELKLARRAGKLRRWQAELQAWRDEQVIYVAGKLMSLLKALGIKEPQAVLRITNKLLATPPPPDAGASSGREDP